MPDSTSFHWHGIRQLHSALQDGANGVTECPIPPGSSRTYNFLAQQYGTTWYHSHFTAQYGNGVVGQLVINGPASLPYDIDLGAFPISDYYYAGADQIVQLTKNAGPPASDNVLFNGTNINPQDPTKGKYANVTLTPGKRHRLRLINPSVENHYSVTLQNHTMTIISSDLVPVNAQTVNSVFLGVGQRIDVTIDASKNVDNYWVSATKIMRLFPNGAPTGPLCPRREKIVANMAGSSMCRIQLLGDAAAPITPIRRQSSTTLARPATCPPSQELFPPKLRPAAWTSTI
jgi:FtsP/CotA-like multicopper oxidase with cupredoxin domain